MAEKSEFDKLFDNLETAVAMAPTNRTIAELNIAITQASALVSIAESLDALVGPLSWSLGGDGAPGAVEEAAPATAAEPHPLAVGDVVVLDDPDDPDDDEAEELIVTGERWSEGVQSVDVIWPDGTENRNVRASQFKRVGLVASDGAMWEQMITTRRERAAERAKASKKKGKGE